MPPRALDQISGTNLRNHQSQPGGFILKFLYQPFYLVYIYQCASQEELSDNSVIHNKLASELSLL